MIGKKSRGSKNFASDIGSKQEWSVLSKRVNQIDALIDIERFVQSESGANWKFGIHQAMVNHRRREQKCDEREASQNW